MNEKPKSIWKKSWKGPHGLFLWFILLAIAAFAVIFSIGYASRIAHPTGELIFFAVLYAICLALIGTLMIAFIRWLFNWRNFKRFLFGLACFITLIALFYAEEDWRGKHDWNKFKRQWEAKGEKFDFASIIPPPVPDDQNFALTPIMFTSYGYILSRDGKVIPYKDRDTNFVNRLQMNVEGDGNVKNWPTNGYWAKATITDLSGWQNYYRALAATTNEFPVAPQPQTPAECVLLALSKYDSTIEELRQASLLPYSRFPLDYDSEDPAAILLPHLAALKQCSQVLELRAIAELQNNESQKALDDVKLSLRLMDSVRTEPFLISHLVRAAILQIALQPVYEGLAEHKWSDAQLVALDSELAKLDFLADYKLAMHGELGFQDGIVRFLQKYPEQFPNLTGMSDENSNDHKSTIESIVATAMRFHLVPSGWFYQNQLHCARPMEEFYLAAADVNQQTLKPVLIRGGDATFIKERKNLTPFNILESIMLPALGASAKKFAYAQSSTDLARVAIALERYRLVRGNFPDSLDAFAPQFMEKIPHDIINGEPLHYRLDDGQFVLYSVGWNETDDGGVVVLDGPFGKSGNLNINKGDWVWRYPQK